MFLVLVYAGDSVLMIFLWYFSGRVFRWWCLVGDFWFSVLVGFWCLGGLMKQGVQRRSVQQENQTAQCRWLHLCFFRTALGAS